MLLYGKGRVFHSPLGHVWRNQPRSHVSLQDPQLQLLLARGTEWAATGRCTLGPADFGLQPIAKAGVRPTEPWLFRCSLDERMSVLFAALDEHLLLAYDMARCGLWKAWGGTAKSAAQDRGRPEGPALRSLGRPYLVDEKITWHLVKGSGSQSARQKLSPRFEGFRTTAEGGALITWSCPHPRTADRKIRVQEAPRHLEAGKPVLQRDYMVSGLADDERLELSTGLPAAQNESTYTASWGRASLVVTAPGQPTVDTRPAVRYQNVLLPPGSTRIVLRFKLDAP